MAPHPETLLRERHAQPLDAHSVTSFERAQVQIGSNWCWAAVVASVLEDRSGRPHRQCEVVQTMLGLAAPPCHLAATPGQDLRPARCDPAFCVANREADVVGNLGTALAARYLLYADVIDLRTAPLISAPPEEWLSDGEHLPTQIEMHDVIKVINRDHLLVLRFTRRRRSPHFIVIYGYAVSASVAAVRFFDPARGAPAGLRLHTGHGVLPLREVKRRYGTAVNCMLVNPKEPPTAQAM